MASLLILVLLIVLPGLFTWAIVCVLLAYGLAASRRRVLATAVPLGALLPLLPITVWLAMTSVFYNPVPIAIAGTLLVGTVVALCVCLPVALATTRNQF